MVRVTSIVIALAVLSACSSAPENATLADPPAKMTEAEEAYVTRVNQSFARSDADYQAKVQKDIQSGLVAAPKNGAQGLTRNARLLLAPSPDRPPIPGTEAGLYTVVIQLVVDIHGFPDHLRVESSTDRRFDGAAISAVAKWRFAPALFYGRPQASTVFIPLAFQPLEDFSRPLRFYY